MLCINSSKICSFDPVTWTKCLAHLHPHTNAQKRTQNRFQANAGSHTHITHTEPVPIKFIVGIQGQLCSLWLGHGVFTAQLLTSFLHQSVRPRRRTYRETPHRRQLWGARAGSRDQDSEYRIDWCVSLGCELAADQVLWFYASHVRARWHRGLVNRRFWFEAAVACWTIGT